MLVTIIVTVATAVPAVGILWVLARKLWRRMRVGLSKVGAATDALLGRDAVLHPDTGEVLVPATPGLNVRLAVMEEAVATMAKTQANVAALSTQLTELTSAFHDHLTAADDHDRKVWDALKEITLRIPLPPKPEHDAGS